MKFGLIFFVLAVLLVSCGTTGSNPAVSGLIGLDAAIDEAVQDIESKLPKGTPIVVTVINAPQQEVKVFIGDELSSRFKNLKTLSREAALSEVEKEQFFQMSGMVSDESAVGIGHFIGARAVISGEMKTFADFTQLRFRIVNVETSETFIYTARINNKDRLLANIMPPAVDAADRVHVTKVIGKELEHLNMGNDLLAKRKYDEALQEFNQAIAINNKLVDAYFGRGTIYRLLAQNDRIYGNNNSADANADKAIAEFTIVIQFNSNNAEAYYGRGDAHRTRGNADQAIADFTSTIRINRNHMDAYRGRARSYLYFKSDFDKAISDYTRVIQTAPNDLKDLYATRGEAYKKKGDLDRARADYNQVIQLSTKAIQINPTPSNYNSRASAYQNIGDIDNAIADYEEAVKLGYDFLQSTIDRLRRQQGR